METQILDNAISVNKKRINRKVIVALAVILVFVIVVFGVLFVMSNNRNREGDKYTNSASASFPVSFIDNSQGNKPMGDILNTGEVIVLMDDKLYKLNPENHSKSELKVTTKPINKFALSHDKHLIAFTTQELDPTIHTNKPSELFIYDIDNQTTKLLVGKSENFGKPLGAAVNLREETAYGIYGITFSPDDRTLAYVRDDIFLLRLQDNSQVKLEGRPSVFEWSEDQKYLAMTYFEDDADMQSLYYLKDGNYIRVDTSKLGLGDYIINDGSFGIGPDVVNTRTQVAGFIGKYALIVQQKNTYQGQFTHVVSSYPVAMPVSYDTVLNDNTNADVFALDAEAGVITKLTSFNDKTQLDVTIFPIEGTSSFYHLQDNNNLELYTVTSDLKVSKESTYHLNLPNTVSRIQTFANHPRILVAFILGPNDQMYQQISLCDLVTDKYVTLDKPVNRTAYYKNIRFWDGKNYFLANFNTPTLNIINKWVNIDDKSIVDL